MKTRLVYDPSKHLWRQEKVTEADVIFDFQELTALGVGMRYDRLDVIASLQKAIVDLGGD